MGILWTGDPVNDMEIAKNVVARHPDVDLFGLMFSAANPAAPHSARIAATWCLGFVDDAGRSSELLLRIVADDTAPPDLRKHAMQAFHKVTDRSPRSSRKRRRSSAGGRR